MRPKQTAASPVPRPFPLPHALAPSARSLPGVSPPPRQPSAPRPAHSPDDPPEWGQGKPISTGRTLSLLAGAGAFALWFRLGDLEARVVLEEQGDYALWGPGLAHSWQVLQPSLVVTLRWGVVD